jgi:hypothetical protein
MARAKIIIDKFKRKRLWENFEERRCSIEMVLKDKIVKYIKKADEKNGMLMLLFKTTASNIQDAMLTKIEEIRKKRLLFERMSKMSNSIDELEVLKDVRSNKEEIYDKWWHSKSEEEGGVVKQFEEDNLFYIDKKTWNEIIMKKVNVRIIGKESDHEELQRAKTNDKKRN